MTATHSQTHWKGKAREEHYSESPGDGGDQAMRFPAVKLFVTYASPLPKSCRQSQLYLADRATSATIPRM